MASIKENPASCEVAKEEAEDEFAEEFEEEMEEDLEEDDYEDIEEDDYEDIEEDEYEDIEEEAYEDKEKTQEDEQKLEAKENGAEKEEAKEAEEVKEANEVKEAKEEAKEEEEEVEEEEENEGEEEDDDEDDEEVESSEEESEEEDGVEEAGEKVVAAKDAAEEMIEVQVVKKEEEFVQVLGRPEEKLVMCEQLSASEGTALLPVLQSVTDLAQFHEALSKFLIQWKSLNGYFVSIISAIKALPRHAAPSLEQVKDIPSQPQINFDAASGKSVRKYIENNLDNLAGVRCEVIEALRTHSNPGKLVLQAIGRFYTQKNLHCLPHVNHRRASILLLEFLVLSGRTNDDTSLKEEAYAAALTWRERLITSGLQSATAVDSLGLILFLACYGIPEEFSLKELSILLCKCNMKEKGDVFRRSRILVEKISGSKSDRGRTMLRIL